MRRHSCESFVRKPMTFIDDLNKAAENIQRKADAKVRRVALAAFQEINRGSPVDKGTFRANWVMSIDTIDRSFDLSKTRKDIQESVSAATAMITTSVKCGTTVFISNSVPYAVLLENGYSIQKPAGVVTPAVTMIKNKIESGRL